MHDPAEPPLYQAIVRAIVAALKEAETGLPSDVVEALQRAREKEKNPVALRELDNILANITLAADRNVPLCQDTGVIICYVTLPPTVAFTQGLIDAIREGVQTATIEIPLRPNVVDPLTRKNTGTNIGVGIPLVHVSPGDRFTITVVPKGAGSENASRSAMLLPSDRKGIRNFVLDTMLRAEGKPCPPVILGVGIGSTFDGVSALAKEALLLPIGEMNQLEQELCDAVNHLGIGPMGLGGETTVLAVKVKIADCHTASLPVAVNIQCWAARRATRILEVSP